MEALLLIPFLVIVVEIVLAPFAYVLNRRRLRADAARRGRRVALDDVFSLLAPVTSATITFGVALALGVIVGRG